MIRRLLSLLSGWQGSVAALVISAALAGSAVWKFQQMRYQGQLARLHALLATEHQKLTTVQLKAKQQVIDKERQTTTQIAEIDRQYQQEREREKVRHLAELRAAHRKLYIGVKAARSACRLSPTATPASRDHDQTRAELSTASARFLVGEAGRADQIVRQLSACQAVVKVDRGMQLSTVETGARRDNGRDRSTTGNPVVVEKMEEGIFINR